MGSVSYLRYKGRKLISAWPNGSISDSDHVTRKIVHIIDAIVDSITNDPSVRLKTSTVVTIPPHNITIIPLEPPLRALQCKGVNTELFEVIVNPLSSIEQLYLLILNTLHKFDSRYPEQSVMIAVNVSDEDIILNKGMTLYFVQETDLTTETSHAQDTDTVNTVNKEDMIDTKREILGNSQEITLDSNRENCHNSNQKTSTYTIEFSIHVTQRFLSKT